MRGTILGGPNNKDYSICWGPFYVGNYHLRPLNSQPAFKVETTIRILGLYRDNGKEAIIVYWAI